MDQTVLDNRFRKSERVKSQKAIDGIFSEGKAISEAPFKLFYLDTHAPALPPLKLLIAVSKKRIPHAVDRNRIKRLIREAYRQNKHKVELFYKEKSISGLLAIVFNGSKPVDYVQTSAAIIKLLDRLIRTHEKTAN